MNRIWLAVIAGLILGFVLMGMMLRGCEAGAEISDARPTSNVNLGPVSKLPKSIAASPESELDLRSTFGAATQPVPLMRSFANSDGARNSTQTLTAFRDRGAQSEFGFAQNFAAARNQSGRNRSAASLIAERDAAIAAELERRRTLRGNGQEFNSSVATLEARSLAQSELLAQIEREQRRESADDRQTRLDGVADESGAGEDARGGPNDNPADDVFFAEGTRAAAFTVNGRVIGGNFENPGSGGENGGNNGGNNGGSTGGNNGGDPTDPTPIGDGEDDDTPPVVTPPGEDDPNPEAGPAIIARWAPVEIDSSCGALSQLRTNDLYLGFRDPWTLQIVTSAPPLSLNIVGGSFRQDPAGSNVMPDAQTLQLAPCAAFDTYLAVGDAVGLLMPVAPNASNWGGMLNAVWGTPTTQPLGIPGTKDVNRFGDERFYVRIGRFTASANPQFVGGTIVVNAFDLSTFSLKTEIVTVAHDPTLWAVEVSEPTEVSLIDFQLDDDSVLGGESVSGVVTLSAPAPADGVTIELQSSSPAVHVPTTIEIDQGETSAEFVIDTDVVSAPVNATLAATYGGNTIFASLSLAAAPSPEKLKSVTVSPTLVRGPMTATGRVTLGSPAPQGGRVVILSSDDLSVVNVPTHVVVPAGQSQATFDVQVAPVHAARTILIWGAVDDQIRTASLLVTAGSDLNGDGKTDGADLAILLARWNTADPLADLNDDGVVNGVDLAHLLTTFNTNSPSGSPFTGAVIARWIPVPILSDCPEFEGAKSNDLYFGFTLRPDVPGGPVFSSSGASQLFMTGGQVRQHPFGAVGPTSDSIINAFPCVAYDSYLTIGGAAPSFLGTVPNNANWGTVLDTEWFTTSFGSIVVEQDVGKFGDIRFYVRAGRFTADEGIRIDGEMVVHYTSGGNSQPSAVVKVPQCPICWISFDLNEDGSIDSADVEFVMTRMNTEDAAADLDRDGVVTARDLELIVGEAAKTSGQ